MPYFSNSSKAKLSTCDPRLQDICNTLIQWYDFSVICGYRNEEEQNALYDSGKSQVKYPNSKHNKIPSQAIDITPYPVDWSDRESFTYLAGWFMAIAKMKNIEIIWGGDWNGTDNNRGGNSLKDNSFDDLGHFELRE
tara:strand:- start:3344 stop:3754 length:411 start_codon:yes stop_codon:yes gene_type:complete